MNRAILHRILPPLLLLLLTIIAFGLLIPWLGLYWDDWAKLLVGKLVGLRGYWNYYAEDRPLSAWTHVAFTPLLGYRPAAWQVFNLLLRWLSAWGMFWTLNGLWQGYRLQNLMASMLFLVSPVFLQQPAAVTFFQQWLQFALFFFSLGAMVRAIHAPRRAAAWTAVSLVAMLLQLSVTEYFVPLELARFVVLWIAASDQPSRFRRVFTASLPYLVMLAAYVFWRLFLIDLPGSDPYRAKTLYAFLDDPAGTVRAMLPVLALDLQKILFSSWTQILPLDLANATRFTSLSIAGGAVGALLTGWLLAEPSFAGSEGPPHSPWLRQAFLLGAVALLLGPVPAWITGRQVVFDFHSDRYAIAALFGAALLLTAAITWVTAGRRLQSVVLAGILVFVALGMHMRAVNDYRWIWTDQMRFFWQLSWRAPDLKPQTAIFLESEPFPNQGLFSTSAALNLLYPQSEPLDPARMDLDYWVYTLRPRFQNASYDGDITLHTNFRTLYFDGKTPQSLLIYNSPPFANCLWVLSKRDRLHPYLPPLVKEFLPISNLQQVEPTSRAAPPSDLFGAEPPRDWCYFFEKADLARQFGDWTTAAAMAEEAVTAGYQPSDSASNSPYEWLPMVEGLARAGRVDSAVDLTRKALAQDPHYSEMYCALWTELSGSLPDLQAPLMELGCAQP